MDADLAAIGHPAPNTAAYGRWMADDFTKGDKVSWSSHGGEAVGEVEQTITSDTEAGGRTVRASKDDPQYLVKSEKSGGEAVHKPDALHKE
jgi:hypothetical protein